MSSNKIITLMRGDSFSTPILVNIGTNMSPEYYSLTQNDTLYFGLMEPNQSFEDAVLKKKYDFTSPQDQNGNTLLILTPKDTEKLLVGKYYYMIKLRTIDAFDQEIVRTVVSPTLFWLQGNNVESTDDVYYDDNKYDIEKIIFEGGEIL